MSPRRAQAALRTFAVELGERPEAGGAGRPEVAGHGLDVAHDAQRVAADELRDVEAVAQGLQATRAPSLRTFAELDGNA